MAARRILKLAVLILLLVWEPGPSSERAPHDPPEGGGAWLDVGLRFDPEHPWTSWRVYVDLHRGSSEPEAELDEASSSETAPKIELGPESLARAAGGASYNLLRGALESLPRGEGSGEGR